MHASHAADPVDETVSGWPGAAVALEVYLLLLLLLPQQLIVGPLGFAGSPATIWGIGCFAWWVWFHVNRVHHVSEPRGVRVAALLFLGAVLLSYTHAMMAPMAPDELSVADAGILRVLSWLGVMMVAADGLPDLRSWWRVLDWLIVLCALLGLLGILQSLTGQTWVDRLSIPGLTVNAPIELTDPRDGHARPVGTATHAIEFGQILTMGLVVATAMSTVRGTFVRRAAAVVCAGTALLVVSRSAVLSITVAFAVLASALTRRQRIEGAVVGLLVLVSAYMLRPGLLGTLSRMFTGIEGDASARSRTDSYSYAFHAYASHPFIGKGFATFLPKYRILDNQWLLSAIEIGAVGVLSLLVLMAAVVRSGFRAEPALAERADRVVARSCTAAVIAVCAGMLFYDGFAFPQATGLLFLASGLVGGVYRISRHSASDAPGQPAGHPAPSRRWAASARTMSERPSRT